MTLYITHAAQGNVLQTFRQRQIVPSAVVFGTLFCLSLEASPVFDKQYVCKSGKIRRTSLPVRADFSASA